MRHKLVVYKKQTYQAIHEDKIHYILKMPYVKDAKEFKVRKNHCLEYPRTFTDIVNRWIPNSDPLEGWTPHLYVLETLDRLLSPKFLLAPKEPGFYIAIWQEGNKEVRVNFLLFYPGHSSLTPEQVKERINTFEIQYFRWGKMEDMILNFRNIRFIPFNPGIGFPYLLHLLESDIITREEFDDNGS